MAPIHCSTYPGIDGVTDSRRCGHNLWGAGWPVVVTILGWLVLLKALAYLLLPFEAMMRLVRRVNTPASYVGGGAASLLLGLFLAGKGFGLL